MPMQNAEVAAMFDRAAELVESGGFESGRDEDDQS